MRQVLRTTDLSLVESFRIAAESEGIETIVTSDSSGALPFMPTAVAVRNDADYDRAVALLRTLSPMARTTPTPAFPLSVGRLLIMLIVIAALIACIGIFS